MVQLVEDTQRVRAGSAPLAALVRVPLAGMRVFAKCEFSAPAGSHKYRVYRGIVDALERSARGLRRGDTLVDFTSGNGGIALAQVAVERGYRACVVTPSTISREKLEAIRALDARVHSVPPTAPYGYVGPDDLLRARLMAARIAGERGYWFLDQANNPANAIACEAIGREICDQLTETPTHLICGIGTGGAITGIARVMKKLYPTLRVIGVEPAESTSVVARLHHKTPHHGAHRLSGLGAGGISASLDLRLLDDGFAVDEAEWCSQLTRLHSAGFRVGKSSAAGFAGASRISALHPKAVCVTIFFDSLDRYKSELVLGSEAGPCLRTALSDGSKSSVGADGQVELQAESPTGPTTASMGIARLSAMLRCEPLSSAAEGTLKLTDEAIIDRVFEAVAGTPFQVCDADDGEVTAAQVRADVGDGPVVLRLRRQFSEVSSAISAMKRGTPVIVLDEREEEGDFFLACSKATEGAVNLMLREGRGVLCVAMELSRFQQLGIRSARELDVSYNETPFGEPVDYLVGTTTGVSAADRCSTIRALVDPETTPAQLRRNGHVRTLEAQEEGLRVRHGHTEAAVELAGLAGLPRAAALIEILTEDGSLARPRDLLALARRLNAPIIRVAQLRDFIADSDPEF